MDTAIIFDKALGEEAKEEGMAAAAAARKKVLALAREIARHFCTTKSRLITIDDVQEGLINCGYHPSDLGKAAGSVFRGKDWEFTGNWVRTKRVSSHAREVKLWRYIGA